MSDVARRFAQLGVATVYEASGRKGLVRCPLIQLQPASRVAGRARIANCAQDDNLAVHTVMEHVQPGEIVVLAMPEPRPTALIGDLLALQARVRGAAAILVDAAVRDREELEQMGLPIWARWVSAEGAAKDDPGGVDNSVTIGGAAIAAGDLIVLDTDGVVVVRSDEIEQTLAASEARFAKEETLRDQIEGGALTLDLMSLRRAEPGT